MGFAGRLARVLREPYHLWKILESGAGLPRLDRKVTDIHHVMTTLNVANTGLVPELVVFSEYDSKKTSHFTGKYSTLSKTFYYKQSPLTRNTANTAYNFFCDLQDNR